MTPQDIREKTFEKAMFGGYDMAAVQNYQEEVATELANAQKEVAVLKGKMKVLVDKIEEYRASEDAMRLAILSAQKVGKQIEDDAQARADKILGEANARSLLISVPSMSWICLRFPVPQFPLPVLKILLPEALLILLHNLLLYHEEPLH